MQSSVPLRVSICHAEPIIQAGLAALLADCPDIQFDAASAEVVITDYEDGLARARHGSTPVMIVTQRAREWNVRTALAAGVAAYLPQQCAAPDLLDALQTLRAGRAYLHAALLPHVAESIIASGFTRRENEVLGLLAQGCSNKQIARQLEIELGTVKTHIKSLFAKLGATARTHAVVLATRRGIVCQ